VDFPKASPAASIKEQVGLASIAIDYSRPSAKGRKIFGGLVPFGEVWRTGANEATKITFGAEVTFGGQVVPAGTYALFTIPEEKEWTVILNKVLGQWGSYSYDAKNDLLRVKATPTKLAEPLESFLICVGDMKDDGANLTLAWESTRVSVKIHSDVVKVIVPQIEAAMAAEGKKPYFPSAMFYYEHGLDLKKALAWMDEALKEQPDAVWMVYRKGLIQAKAGDKTGALATAKQALALADKAGGSAGVEYKRLSETLIASLK
jgi:tetratricopeptide (TPR) repeat protein